MVSEPSVLIVGAGAMGMVAGYHLQLGGTRVSFLVRPGRIEAFKAPRQLYCYDDHELKTFDGYRVVDTLAAIADETFDYVILTLDGASSRGSEATAMLASLGSAIAGKKTLLLIGGVGVGLREHVLQTTQLPEPRVLNGALALLAHQVSANLPVHAPTRPELLAQAAIAYRHVNGTLSFVVDSSLPAAREFVALYNRSSVSRGALMNAALFGIMGNAAFPMLAASEIAGWPKIDALVAQRELWHLSCQAQNEITALAQFGWIGKLVALLMTDTVNAAIQRKVERDAMPLDYQAFNRFHHGGKLRAQDVQVMHHCVAAGERQGKPMTALRTLLDRLDAQQRAA